MPTCYTKLGNKWYPESQIGELTGAYTERNKLLNDLSKLNLNTKKDQKKSTTIQDKISQIDKDINTILDGGTEGFRDAAGNAQIDDIFDIDRRSTRSNKTQILDNLTKKAHGLNASNDSSMPTPYDIWNAYKVKFKENKISQSEVQRALKSSIDPVAKEARSKDLNSAIDASKGGTINTIKRIFFREISKYGHLNQFKELAEHFIARNGRIGAAVSKATRNMAELNKKTKKLTIDQKRNIALAIRNGLRHTFDPTGIKPALASEIDILIGEIRNDLDLLSAYMVADGNMNHTMMDLILNNLGEYSNITYEVFTNPEWINTLFETAGGKAIPKTSANHILANARNHYRSVLPKEIKRLERRLKYKANQIGKTNDRQKINELKLEMDAISDRIDSINSSLQNPDDLNQIIYDDLLQLSGNNSFELSKGLDSPQIRKTQQNLFKRREDIPDSLRKLWGSPEVSTDPIFQIMQGAIKMSTYLGNVQFQRNLADTFNSGPYFTFNQKEALDRGWVPVKTINNRPGWSPFRSEMGISEDTVMYAHPAVADVMDGVNQSKVFRIGKMDETDAAQQNIWDTLKFISALIKTNMTVYTVDTQKVNYLGNVAFALKSGQAHKPKFWTEFVKSTYDLLNHYRVGAARNENVQEILDLAEANNLLKSSLELEIIRELGQNPGKLKKITDKLDNWASKNKFGRFFKNIDGFLKHTYEFGDAIWKIVDFKLRLDTYTDIFTDGDVKSFKDLTDLNIKDQVIEQAAKETRQEYVNFHEVPYFVQRLKNTPFLAAFPSFMAGAMQVAVVTPWRQMNHIAGRGLPKGLTQNQKAKIRKKAIGELAANIAVAHMAYFLPSIITQTLGGFGEDEEKFVRDHILPEWQNNAVLIKTKDGGNISAYPTGYYNPTNVWYESFDPLIRTLSGRSDTPFYEAVEKSFLTLISPFASADILAGIALDLFRNRTSFGKEISPTTDPVQVFNDYMAYLVTRVGGAPAKYYRAYRNNRQLADAQAEYDSSMRGGIPSKQSIAIDENIQRLILKQEQLRLGPAGLDNMRYTVSNINQGISYALYNAQNKLLQARNNYTKNNSLVLEKDPDKVEAAFNKAQREYQEALNEARDLAQEILRVYPDKGEINKIQIMNEILDGRYLFSQGKSAGDAPSRIPFTQAEKRYILMPPHIWEKNYVEGVVEPPKFESRKHEQRMHRLRKRELAKKKKK